MKQVFFNFQGNAVFGVLAFLGLAFVEALAAGTSVVLILRRRARLARYAAAGAIAAAIVYSGTLLAFSATSREQVAWRGEEKYFCEVDCHVAYSVLDVAKTKSLGAGADRSTARGVYQVVTLRVRFDEDTISSHRSRNLPLTPNPRRIEILDESGKMYPPDTVGQQALASSEGPAMRLDRSLKPGESYTTRLVFDLPESVREPLLLITESDWVTRFLIGHENSFFHRKTSFRIG
jgi:hypothetical protein